MASIHDLTAYILRKAGPTGGMELHKLLYYAQAWHLVNQEEPLFPDRIEAWPPGPVIPDLYEHHRDIWRLDAWTLGDADRLTADERESVDGVLDAYGTLGDAKLEALVEAEDPWRDARAGLHPIELSHNPITPAALRKYYGSLATTGDALPIAELSWDDWDMPAATA
ncbi:Panacea domain-containing protein [Actinoplanes sp. RD1]|uniref:Panacea domain-containing protein n=1 Tax=Actinoplanes sp. RD1 TaxID=3064538 RepID=UPI0027421D06|nr:type II toxin-antitoxin system antitoxin SocA domain-containing protein [Actinoplanes sp. RD1]